jgi:hypothetical protein
VRDLREIAHKIEKLANLNNRSVLIESELPNYKGEFFIAINDEGTLGAYGNVIQDKTIDVMFFILDDNKVKYCLDEGWELDQIYQVMGDKLFIEVTEDNFMEIMTEKKSLDL